MDGWVGVVAAIGLVTLMYALGALGVCWLAHRADPAHAGAGRRAAIGLGVALVLLVAQAALLAAVLTGGRPAAGAPGLPGLDGAALTWFSTDRHERLAAVAAITSALGDPDVMFWLAVLAVAALLVLRRWREALVVGVATIGTEVLRDGLKEFLDRDRPPRAVRLVHAGGESLPSGHALASIVVLGLVAAVLVGSVRGGARYAAPIVALLLITAVGWSRLYLGVHWLTDVAAGWLIGAGWLALAVPALALTRGPATPGPATRAPTPTAAAPPTPHAPPDPDPR